MWRGESRCDALLNFGFRIRIRFVCKNSMDTHAQRKVKCICTLFALRVKLSTPDEFFSEVEARDAAKLCHWSGELYLELHNGTYTSQAKVRQRQTLYQWLQRPTLKRAARLKFLLLVAIS